MIFTLVAALLAQITPVSTVRVSERTGSVQIPDEIAPAVVPYVMCLSNQSNAAIKGIMARDKVDGLDAPRVREANNLAIADCKATRDTAAGDAREALDARGLGNADTRSKLVENTLLNVEASFTAGVDGSEAASSPQTAPGK